MGPEVVDQWITTTSGMRGMFPVHMVKYSDGLMEPWQTGETARDMDHCVAMAKDWAAAEGIEYRP